MKELIHANLYYLRQAAELVKGLDDSAYAASEPAFYHSSVGRHLRHCLEHYESFVRGLVEGRIDYDARMRDPDLEQQTGAASARIRFIRQALENTLNSDLEPGVLVKLDCCTDDAGLQHAAEKPSCDEWQVSTLGRELQFLVSHTVHHFAMIRGICQLAGKELDDEFGIAPSTLRYQRQHGLATSSA